MQKGFNSDLTIKGQSYHIQTEDWGLGNPYVVSRVFQQGAVLKTFKTHYSKFMGSQPEFWSATPYQQHLQIAMKHQHDQVVDFVVNGKIR